MRWMAQRTDKVRMFCCSGQSNDPGARSQAADLADARQNSGLSTHAFAAALTKNRSEGQWATHCLERTTDASAHARERSASDARESIEPSLLDSKCTIFSTFTPKHNSTHHCASTARVVRRFSHRVASYSRKSVAKTDFPIHRFPARSPLAHHSFRSFRDGNNVFGGALHNQQLRQDI